MAVIDASMPDGGGWAAARGLSEVCPGIRLVAFTSFDNALVIRTIAAAGINAYVTKGSAIEVLLAAIHGEDVMPAPPQRMPLIRRAVVSLRKSSAAGRLPARALLSTASQADPARGRRDQLRERSPDATR